MNRSIRHIALVIGLAFAALLFNLNYVQIGRSRALSEHPANRRLLVEEYAIERGQIIAGDVAIAQSEPSGERLRFVRRYPGGPLFGHISGYYSLVFGRSGLERSYNRFLTGAEPPSARDFIDDLLGRERKGHTLILTLDPDLQQAAAAALGTQRGAVAAVDPQTGAVLALYSFPSFDPNPVSGLNTSEIRSAWDALVTDPARPLVPRATQERYPPGSTFKIVTAAAALELGDMTPQTRFPNPRELDLPDTNRTLGNFGGRACAGGGATITIATGFRVSCNTTFAQVGLAIGADKLIEMAGRFGIDRPTEFDLPLVASCMRPEPGAGCLEPRLNRPQTAFSAIGQFDVRMTPLQMALVTATIANGGTLVHPFVVQEIRDFAGRRLQTTAIRRDGPVLSEETATALRDMMLDTVKQGTGRVVGFSGDDVGGKTGTAQTGIEGQPPHVWFVAFAPGIAVAVVVENGGDLRDEATGGRVAGPVAKAVIESFRKKTGR